MAFHRDFTCVYSYSSAIGQKKTSAVVLLNMNRDRGRGRKYNINIPVLGPVHLGTVNNLKLWPGKPPCSKCIERHSESLINRNPKTIKIMNKI